MISSSCAINSSLCFSIDVQLVNLGYLLPTTRNYSILVYCSIHPYTWHTYDNLKVLATQNQKPNKQQSNEEEVVVQNFYQLLTEVVMWMYIELCGININSNFVNPYVRSKGFVKSDFKCFCSMWLDNRFPTASIFNY